MKVYISLPISGRDIKQVEREIRFAQEMIIRNGHVPVSPLEASPDREASYATHMGNDIKALIESDAVMFLPGWEESNGCRLERCAAEIYGKQKLVIELQDETYHRGVLHEKEASDKR